MHIQSGRYLSVNAIKEAAELGRAVAPMQFANDLAAGHVEGGEQRRRAVSPVIVGASLRYAWPHRQNRLGPIQGLNLSLLVGTQNEGPLGRVEIQADDVTHLLDQVRIVGQLERFGAMRLEPECSPNAMDSRSPAAVRHSAARPADRPPLRQRTASATCQPSRWSAAVLAPPDCWNTRYYSAARSPPAPPTHEPFCDVSSSVATLLGPPQSQSTPAADDRDSPQQPHHYHLALLQLISNFRDGTLVAGC